MPAVEVKVCKNGNSAAVTLPAEWRRQAHVEVGDTVEVYYEYNGPLYIAAKKPQHDTRRQLFAELMKDVEHMPRVPWDDDSSQADRDLLEKRYV